MNEMEGSDTVLKPERESNRLSYMLGVIDRAKAFSDKQNEGNGRLLKGKIVEALEAMNERSSGTWMEAWTRLMAYRVVDEFPKIIDGKTDEKMFTKGNIIVLEGVSFQLWSLDQRRLEWKHCPKIEINVGRFGELHGLWKKEMMEWDKKRPDYDGQWDG